MNKIDLNLLKSFKTHSPSELVFWSFRYFLGRMTIATCCFARELAESWSYLDPRIQDLIKKELEQAFADDDDARGDVSNKYYPLGHDCDREAWETVRKAYNKNEKN